jgi:hypothetical protein
MGASLQSAKDRALVPSSASSQDRCTWKELTYREARSGKCPMRGLKLTTLVVYLPLVALGV